MVLLRDPGNTESQIVPRRHPNRLGPNGTGSKAVKSTHFAVEKPTHFALAPTRPGKVSIFYDKTLQPGDAVMSFKGIRIFAGSKSWPYHDSDFVALADAKQLDKGMRQ